MSACRQASFVRSIRTKSGDLGYAIAWDERIPADEKDRRSLNSSEYRKGHDVIGVCEFSDSAVKW